MPHGPSGKAGRVSGGICFGRAVEERNKAGQWGRVGPNLLKHLLGDLVHRAQVIMCYS